MDKKRIKRSTHIRNPHERIQSALGGRAKSSNFVAGGLIPGKPARRPTKNPTARPISPLIGGGNKIIITGGIGDFLAVDSFMSAEERAKITGVVLITRASEGISKAILSNPEWSKKSVEVVHFDWTKRFCFFAKEEALAVTGTSNLHGQASDYSIGAIFGQIKQNRRTYHYSSFMANTVANIDRFDLPQRYIAICPQSINDRNNPNRSLESEDWQYILDFLRQTKQKGVILNLGRAQLPSDPSLIDLSDSTSLPEAIEIVKRSSGYLGIDSSLSVIASKTLNYPDIIVKSNNSHLMNNKEIYYAPHENCEFIARDFSSLKRLWK